MVTPDTAELAIAARGPGPKNGSMTTLIGALLCGALAAPAAGRADGAHDFDFAFGTWTTRLSRRERPLTGSQSWVEYTGTTVVRKVWAGRAQLVELDVTGPAGRIEGLSLRLYDPETRRWSLNFANARGGGLFPPTIGAFADRTGTFTSDETLDGRPIQVRFVITEVTPDEYRYEQAFSADAGRTWEVNWIATDTRVKDR
jgi:hypothetical protein